MSYTVNIDNFDKTYWQQQAKQFADYTLYQTWPYQQNRAQMDGCKISRATVTDETGNICLMCHVRIKEVKALGMKIGYIQWGPLVRGYDNTIKCTPQALIELKKAYLENMVNVLRIVPNMPDNEIGRKFSEMLNSAGFKFTASFNPYRTLVVDFDDGEEGVLKGFSSNVKRSVKKAKSSDLVLKHDNGHDGFSILTDMYSELQHSKGFGGLNMDEFIKPQQMLTDDEKMTLLLVYNKHRPVASILSSNLGDSGMLLLAAANEEGRKLGGTYLSWYSSIMDSLQKGKQKYDLGGIDPLKNPGVYSFKSRMGGREIYHIGAFDASSSAPAKVMWTVSDNVRKLVKT